MAQIHQLVMLGVVLVLTGCAGPSGPSSTRFLLSDFTESAATMSELLASSRFLEERDASSEPVLLMPVDVVNLSDDRIGEADRWALVATMLDNQTVEYLESKNVWMRLPEEREPVLRRYAIVQAADTGAPLDAPTHLLNLTFRSATRVADVDADVADARTALLQVYADIVEVDSGRIVWSGSDHIVREARGLLID